MAESRGKEVRISATDLDVSLRTACPAEVASEGSITLGAKKLYEIARSLPESEVRLKVLPDSWAAIECERVNFKMAGLPREDFPALPEGKAKGGVEIPGEVLRDLIGRTAFAITAEDARYYLAGALLLLEPRPFMRRNRRAPPLLMPEGRPPSSSPNRNACSAAQGHPRARPPPRGGGDGALSQVDNHPSSPWAGGCWPRR